MARLCDPQRSDHAAHQVAASKADWEWQRLWASEGWLPALLLLVHHRRPCVKSSHLSEPKFTFLCSSQDSNPDLEIPGQPSVHPLLPPLSFSDLRGSPSFRLYGMWWEQKEVTAEDILTPRGHCLCYYYCCCGRDSGLPPAGSPPSSGPSTAARLEQCLPPFLLMRKI